MNLWIALANLALLLVCSDALYQTSGPVKLLNPKNFKSEVLDSDLPSVVEFFAPWCGHCKQLAPTYKKVADNLQGMINVAAVDCDDASHKSLCSKYQIQGFPTIKLFPSDKQKNPYTKKIEKTPTDYNGPRSAKAIADAALGLLPDTFVTTIRGQSEFDSFKEAGELPKVVLLSSKARATPLYKSLSLRFKGRLAFALAKDNDKAVTDALGLDESPALVILTPDGDKVAYDGKFKANPLISFLAKHAVGAPDKDAEPSAKRSAKSDSDADAADDEDEGADGKDKVIPQVVQEMKLEDLEKLRAEEDPWLIAFFNGKPSNACNATLRSFNKAVADLGPLIKAAQVNVTSDEDVAKTGAYGVNPAVLHASSCELDVLLAPFEDKSDAEDWQHYKGELDGRELQKFVLGAFPSFVTRLSASTLQAFLAADPKSPTVILFTDKEETPAVYAALSANLRKYKYRFVDVHRSDATLMKDFNVQKVPSMVMMHLKPGTEEGKEPMMGIQPYPGPLKYPYMHSFLATFAGMMGAAPEGGADDSFMDAIGATQRSNVAPREVPEAATDAELHAQCLDQASGLCVLALLDAADPALEAHLGILKLAAGKWAKQPLHFSWVNAARQGTFLSAFGLSKADIPTVVTFSPKKLRGAQLTGAFSSKGIDTLLDGLFSGRIHSSPFQELPQLVEGGEQEAAAEEPLEDEFDLADVLGEEVGGSGSKEELLKKVEQELEEEERRKAEAEAAHAKADEDKKKKGGKKKKKRKAKSEGEAREEL